MLYLLLMFVIGITLHNSLSVFKRHWSFPKGTKCPWQFKAGLKRELLDGSVPSTIHKGVHFLRSMQTGVVEDCHLNQFGAKAYPGLQAFS